MIRRGRVNAESDIGCWMKLARITEEEERFENPWSAWE